MILFWFKTSIAASSMRVQCKSPNTLLGVIPLGSSTQTIPLRNIASVDTNIFLIAGLACMKDSALVGILFLVLAAANLANTMSAQLDFVNQAGGRNTVKVSILEKAKLMQLAQAIQQLVFAGRRRATPPGEHGHGPEAVRGPDQQRPDPAANARPAA